MYIEYSDAAAPNLLRPLLAPLSDCSHSSGFSLRLLDYSFEPQEP